MGNQKSKRRETTAENNEINGPSGSLTVDQSDVHSKQIFSESTAWPPPSRKPHEFKAVEDKKEASKEIAPQNLDSETEEPRAEIHPDGKIALNQELVTMFADSFLVRIAFVGAVGTGKSELLHAIAKWYSPNAQNDDNTELGKASSVIPQACIYQIVDLLYLLGYS